MRCCGLMHARRIHALTTAGITLCHARCIGDCVTVMAATGVPDAWQPGKLHPPCITFVCFPIHAMAWCSPAKWATSPKQCFQTVLRGPANPRWKRDDRQARLGTRLSCRRGPPPDAMRMYCMLCTSRTSPAHPHIANFGKVVFKTEMIMVMTVAKFACLFGFQSQPKFGSGVTCRLQCQP